MKRTKSPKVQAFQGPGVPRISKSHSNMKVILVFILHRSHIGSYNYLNCSMKVVYYIFTSTPGVVRIHFWANPRIQVF